MGRRFWWSVIIVLLGLFIAFYLIPAFRGEIEVASGFTASGLKIRYYGLTLALGVLAGWLVSSKLAQKSNLDAQKFDNLLLVTVISGLAGARILVVAEHFDYFWQNPAEIYKFWHGGLAIYGGVMGGAAGALAYAKRIKLPVWKTLDALAAGLPLGQAIGRFGNFFNQEAYGPPTDLPWKMFVSPAARPLEHLGQQFFHPVFLYEAAWNFLIFVIVLNMARTRRIARPGLIFGSYLALYGAGRFFLEFLRLESYFIGEVRFNQLLSVIIFASGCLIIFLSIKRAKIS